VSSIAKTILNRLKQVRSAALRIQGALAGAQLLLSVWPLAALVAVALWVRRRRTRGEHPHSEKATQPADADADADSEASAPSPADTAAGGAPS
ncbi:hypothetical protein MNAB215_3797, partial [Mycobacterium numidiamassiliense]